MTGLAELCSHRQSAVLLAGDGLQAGGSRVQESVREEAAECVRPDNDGDKMCMKQLANRTASAKVLLCPEPACSLWEYQMSNRILQLFVISY